MKGWIRSWYVTLRYGSVLTRHGRELRRTSRDIGNPDAWVEVERPRLTEIPKVPFNLPPAADK